MKAFDLPRRLTAEALGTAFLVAAIVGSGIMAERLTHDVALQLLCNTLPTGAVLVVLISIFGPVSGAHFNPAVSLVFAIRGELPRPGTALYIAAQLVGAIAGTAIAHLMFGLPVLEISEKARMGGGQWFAEAVATFGLVTTILAGLRLQKPATPWLVGLYITAAYWFTASTSFANPAVTLARALTNSFSGIAPASVPLFIVSQAVGALLAAMLAGWLFRVSSGKSSRISASDMPEAKYSSTS
jgi:glycerol uptake facilitator-like aquaporin